MEQQSTMIGVIGSPGSGKTTFTRGVVTSQEYLGRSAYISLGQEVRNIRAGHIDSLVAHEIELYDKSHDHYDLLPDDIINQVAIDALRRFRHTDLNLVMVDGMPRRISQIGDFLHLTGVTYRLGGVIHTTVDKDQALRRLLGRNGRSEMEDSEMTEIIARHRLDLYDRNSRDIPLALMYQHIPVTELPTDGPKEKTLRDGLGRVSVMMASGRHGYGEPA